MKEAKSLVPELRFREYKNDYLINTLGEITIWKSGGTPKKDILKYWEGNIPWISASEMRGKFYEKSQYNITEEGLNKGSNLAKKGTLLLLVRGSMLFNKIPLGITKVDAAFNQDIKSLTVKKDVETEYLYQWFFAKEPKIMNLVVGTGIGAGKLDTNDMKSIQLSLPTIKEQQKIATFLSVVDKKLERLQQMENLLKDYKKGVMQQLFSQALRFKKEDGSDYPDWEEKKLGEICEINKGSQLNAEFLTKEGTYPCINGGISASGFTESFNGEAETITISEGGNSCGYINFITSRFWSGGHCYSLDSINANLKKAFLYHILKYYQIQIMRLRVGSGLPNIQKKDISKFQIELPSIKEQTKIANFLSAIDTKIALVTIQIENTQQFKKGLLQQMFV